MVKAAFLKLLDFALKLKAVSAEIEIAEQFIQCDEPDNVFTYRTNLITWNSVIFRIF